MKNSKNLMFYMGITLLFNIEQIEIKGGTFVPRIDVSFGKHYFL
ncbi:Uncharacterised protein [Klebsiella pneumoniae]|nr:Uncharacterised protein [Klebsiella pneumoniae]